MDTTTLYYLGLPLLAGALILLWALLRRPKKRPAMTTPGLEERAIALSRSLSAFCTEREASRASDLVSVGGHEFHDSDDSEEDPEAQILYQTHYLPRVAELREQFAERRIRERALDRVYESPDSLAEIRTISTGLLVMANRLR
ncbi:hypothetical protein [Rubrobacter aplysinae]|uniref:hypothetical protein n=1 Tax=Rubrobacter aplysinae TaxID=909625 RepID=UPI00064BEB1F|nr:hypothetical protein [Rubrobacter aplysinae]